MSLNVLSAIKIIAQVHHIRQGDIRRKTCEPNHMVQCRDISSIVPQVIIELGSRRRQRAELRAEGLGGLVPQGPDGVRPGVRVDLLPDPPQAVEVGVVQEEQRIPDGAGDVGHRSAYADMAAPVRAAGVAFECYDAIVGSETRIDLRLVTQEKRLLVKGARYAAVVGVELEGGEIVAKVDPQVRERPVVDALAALAAETRDRIEHHA